MRYEPLDLIIVIALVTVAVVLGWFVATWSVRDGDPHHIPNASYQVFEDGSFRGCFYGELCTP